MRVSTLVNILKQNLMKTRNWQLILIKTIFEKKWTIFLCTETKRWVPLQFVVAKSSSYLF